MSIASVSVPNVARRTPHGVRGLKYYHRARSNPDTSSHPARGAWIEIWRTSQFDDRNRSRTPHGVRGLKCHVFSRAEMHVAGRTPHGVRGLKCHSLQRVQTKIRRTPHGVRGLKYVAQVTAEEFTRRTPHGVRGLKSRAELKAMLRPLSHPARGAWIEMSLNSSSIAHPKVAPRTGCVD